MRHRLLSLLAVGTASLVALGVNASGTEQALRAELSKSLSKGLPGISAAIGTRQGVIWTAAVGYSDLESRSLAHPGYLYGIGSITKMFVACVIEQLVDEGRLKLDATPQQILGDAVVGGIPNADRATIRQLLNHTSGIPTWEFDSEWIRRARGVDIALEHIWAKAETLEYIRGSRHPATNAPGAAYNYSNSNYTILGLIVEKVTGADVLEAIRARILAPLGLRDVKLEGFEPVDRARLPSRYQYGTDDFVRTAGGIVATARDMAVFATALRDGAIVGPAGMQRMLTFRSTDDPNEQVADGMFRDRYGSEVLLGYTGNVLGFGASVGWLEGDDVVLVLMTNVGAMHAGDAAYYPEKLLKDTQVIRLAREFAHELAPRVPPNGAER